MVSIASLAAEQFDDVRQVTITAQTVPGEDLVLRGTGLVTRTDCAPGATVTSGTSPLVLDDRRRGLGPTSSLSRRVPGGGPGRWRHGPTVIALRR